MVFTSFCPVTRYRIPRREPVVSATSNEKVEAATSEESATLRNVDTSVLTPEPNVPESFVMFVHPEGVDTVSPVEKTRQSTIKSPTASPLGFVKLTEPSAQVAVDDDATATAIL
jgi:hypothetical protein